MDLDVGKSARYLFSLRATKICTMSVPESGQSSMGAVLVGVGVFTIGVVLRVGSDTGNTAALSGDAVAFAVTLLTSSRVSYSKNNSLVSRVLARNCTEVSAGLSPQATLRWRVFFPKLANTLDGPNSTRRETACGPDNKLSCVSVLDAVRNKQTGG